MPIATQGKVNISAGFVGPEESGKSYLAIQFVRHLNRRGWWALAVDANDDLPTKLDDGTPTGIVRHETLSEALSSLRERGGGVHTISTLEIVPTITAAKEIARASMDAHPLTAEGARQGRPAIVYIDEIVASQQATPHHIDPVILDGLVRRRHNHVVFAYGCQSALACHYMMFLRANILILFYVNNQKDHKRLSDGGVDQETINRMIQLKQYEYLIFISKAPPNGGTFGPYKGFEPLRRLVDAMLTPKR